MNKQPKKTVIHNTITDKPIKQIKNELKGYNR